VVVDGVNSWDHHPKIIGVDGCWSGKVYCEPNGHFHTIQSL
jgi:hypothetical protein